MTDRTKKTRTGSGKKTGGIIIAGLLLTASLSVVAVAATNGVETTPKNVVQTEKTGAETTKLSVEYSVPTAGEEAIGLPVKKEQAIRIVENTLQQMFGTELADLPSEAHVQLNDEASEKKYQEFQKHTYPDKVMAYESKFKGPSWTVAYWEVPEVNAETGETKSTQKNDSYYATVDAVNGELLKVARYAAESAPGEPSIQPISESGTQVTQEPSTSSVINPLNITLEKAKQTATDFVDKHDLAKGVAVVSTTAYDFKTNFQVLIQLENGQTDYVGVNTTTGKVVLYEHNIDETLVKEVQKM
ncbi:hypothetical protein ACIQYS_17530 [Psychrobacillus sp. NPDC096426]|uniref:hypothetical protein n=1 Tax=Psychrobacillus sp. NPDC096426 TaxID=3364491 RepID=UPI00382761BA